MRLPLPFLGILLCAALCGTASAADIYVATDGDDANPGTLASPLGTIQAAADAATAGDTVYLRGGVYFPASDIWIGNSGTPSAPITFRPYADEAAVVDGSAMDQTILVVGGSYVTIRELTIRNGQETGIYTWKGDNNSYIGNTIYNVGKGAITAGGDDWSDGPDNLLIENNTVYQFAMQNQDKTASSGWSSAISASLSTGVVIRGNTVYEGYGEGVNCPLADNCLVENNVVRDVYSVCFYMDNAQSCTIRNNLAYSTGLTEYYRDGGPATGIQIANENSWFAPALANPSQGNTIENNLVLFCEPGFSYGDYEAGGGLVDTTVVNNTFYGSPTYTIHINQDSHSGSVFANNLFFHTSTTDTMWGWDEPNALDGVTFRNNGWYDGTPDGGAADGAGPGDVTADPKLTNPGTYAVADYIPQASSPLIGAASTADAPSQDKRGFPRDDTPDIGALEKTTPIPALTAPGALLLLLLLGREVKRVIR